MTRTAQLFVGIAALALVCGCAPRDSRFQQLTELATAEVREMSNPIDRLARFLQLANLQTVHRAPVSARAARDDARQVLTQSDSTSLGTEPRLAGWISLTELAREAGSLDESRDACGQAETLLHALEPAHERVQYVQSVAREIAEARGRDAAIALYRESAEWAVGMDDLLKRRGAWLAIASGLVELDRVDAAAEVIRRDEDRGWRAQSFIALSDGSPYGLWRQQASMGMLGDIPAPESSTYRHDASFSWKRLDFSSYFRSK